MEDNLFTIKSETKKEKDQSYFYTIIGKQKYFDDDKNPLLDKDGPEVFAKKITLNGKTKHYIKVGTYGKIYNPIGSFSEGTANKFLAKVGKKAWEFEEVNSKVFDMYVNFLRTKNMAWLNNAEREMI